MERKNNYLIQANQAKAHFLTYDQQRLIDKFSLQFDENYIYVNFLCRLYRIERKTAAFQYRDLEAWKDGNSYEEVMTLLDLLCDSREDRHLAYQWKSMEAMGLQFHQKLLGESKDPRADFFDKNPEWLHRGCIALGGRPLAGADISYAIEIFDGLEIALQFWHGDEEFLPRLRYLWDENALQYIRYETMYFAVALLMRRIIEIGKKRITGLL